MKELFEAIESEKLSTDQQKRKMIRGTVMTIAALGLLFVHSARSSMATVALVKHSVKTAREFVDELEQKD